MKLRIAITAAALAAFAAGSAYAQPSPDIQAAIQGVMQACQADSAKLCEGKQGREMFMCLREKEAQASQPCKDAMAKLPARRPQGQAPAGGR